MVGYIYKITNLINHKIYIGKTLKTINERFNEHIKASHKGCCQNRPLYKAMNKYGVENFKIEIVEEVPIVNGSELNQREIFWIAKHDSLKNGYNATIGGDGASYIDYDKVIKTYKKLQSIENTANKIGCDRKTVSQILHNAGVKVCDGGDVSRRVSGKPVAMLNKENNLIKTFRSLNEAAKYVSTPDTKSYKGIAQKIALCVKGERKTAYGYKWCPVM